MWAVSTRLVGARGHGHSQQGCAHYHMQIAVGSGYMPCSEAVLPSCGPFRRPVVVGNTALGAAGTVRSSSAPLGYLSRRELVERSLCVSPTVRRLDRRRARREDRTEKCKMSPRGHHLCTYLFAFPNAARHPSSLPLSIARFLTTCF